MKNYISLILAFITIIVIFVIGAVFGVDVAVWTTVCSVISTIFIKWIGKVSFEHKQAVESEEKEKRFRRRMKVIGRITDEKLRNKMYVKIISED